jgi:hypothetical protein
VQCCEVDIVAHGRAVRRGYFCLPLSVSFHACSMLIPSAITESTVALHKINN